MPGRVLVAAALGSLLLGLVGCQSADTRQLVWSDEFSGAAGTPPNSANWSYETGGAGWGNQELECYTDAPGNVSLDGSGHLTITAIKQPGHVCVDGRSNDYTSARILTHNKFATTYGSLELRAKLPTTSGTWPAFWALGENIDKVGWPQAGETDVVEAIGSRPGWIAGTLHGPKPDGSPFQISVSKETGLDLASTFHIYGARWTADRVVFSLDGRAYGAVTRAQVERAGGQWVWDKPFYLLLNLAVGGTFPGPPAADAPWPQTFTIDWVRVYR
jgi:beta-glucanase (GH16 family)